MINTLEYLEATAIKSDWQVKKDTKDFKNLKRCVLVKPNIELNERFKILRIRVKLLYPKNRELIC